MVLNGKKWSQNVQYGLKWSSMFPNGPKWSKKFNWMAFKTRFNLVLVWSKIVQIFTKKSTKWVRHNQVSWSSFLSMLLSQQFRGFCVSKSSYKSARKSCVKALGHFNTNQRILPDFNFGEGEDRMLCSHLTIAMGVKQLTQGSDNYYFPRLNQLLD